MKVLLITPPYHCGVVEVAGAWLPLNYVYLAGELVKDGHQVVIYDAMTLRHSHADIRKRLASEKADVVAVGAITPTYPDSLEVLKSAKKLDPKVITVLGGVHPTFCHEEILKQDGDVVDYIVAGEGEYSFRDLMRDCQLKIKSSKLKINRVWRSDGFIADLDELTPAWDLLDWDIYKYYIKEGSRLACVSTSRGCEHECSFCSQQKFWQKSWRGRKPEQVVAEMKHLSKEYGADVFLFTDEYPTSERDRWEELLDRLISWGKQPWILMETRAEDIVRDQDILDKYVKAGILHVYVGLEATDQATLDLMKKDLKVQEGVDAVRLLRERDIVSETSFVLGLPEDTPLSVKRTLELATEYAPDMAHFLSLAPWPYADIYPDLKDYVVDKDYRNYNLVKAVTRSKQMSADDFDRSIAECYRDFYMSSLPKLVREASTFRRDYMLKSMKRIMKSSFLRERMKHLGPLPRMVSEMAGRGMGIDEAVS